MFDYLILIETVNREKKNVPSVTTLVKVDLPYL